MKIFPIAFLLFCSTFLFSQTSLIDSLQQEIIKSNDEKKVTLLCELCSELTYQDISSAKTNCQQALELAEEINFKKGKASALQYFGTIEQAQSNYTKALDFQKKSITLFLELNDEMAVANLQNNMGICYDEQGDYQKALQNYFAALKVYEAKNESLSIAQAFNNIGIVYKKQKNYDKVIEYYSKALSIYKNVNHGFGMAVTEGNIGSAFLEKNEYLQAIAYSKLALAKYDSLDIRQYLPYPLGNMGRALIGLKKYDEAILKLEEALQLHQEFGDKRAIAFTQNHLAEAYFLVKKYDLAAIQAELSLALATEIGAKDEAKNANYFLAKIYGKQNNFEKAYQAQLSLMAIKDTLFEIEKTKQIAELQTQYETEKKEQTIELQQLEIEKADTRNKAIVALSIGGFLGLFLVVALGYFFYDNQQKEAQRKKEKIYEKQLLTATIDATEAERKRIAADLHDGIGQQLTGLKMGWQQMTDQILVDTPESAANIRKLTGILDEATLDIRTISHQMMPKTLSEFGLEKAVEAMVEKSFSHTSIEYEFDSFGIEKRLDETVEVGVFRIAQEAVNNVLKHADAKEVSVQLFQNKNHLILTVEDNGKGLKSKSKTDLETGHGLMNMQSRAKALGGEIIFEKGMEGGTILTLRI
ncbi:MAG: tetratricopeptide repeat protein [Saprospiraceae bacterium]